MTTAFIESLGEAFENVDNLNPERIKKLAEETAIVLESLQKKLSSEDPKTQAEAKEAAQEIKRFVEGQMNRLAEMSGLNYQELVEMAQNPQFRQNAIGELQRLEQAMLAKRAPKKHTNNNKTHLS